MDRDFKVNDHVRFSRGGLRYNGVVVDLVAPNSVLIQIATGKTYRVSKTRVLRRGK
jgi:hypothetical protein